ncbi:copper chaperone PCu(A)C [Sulfitobacter albidus]|uniref:Copper chaperone PCu(A)C n=1 Tax=Sulfitobacter albidus TaxID=2829501 RepID=A0A975JEF8_9RHOB|nr:copper chaperone PCu(A)C [Sulfitobacter albidus]
MASRNVIVAATTLIGLLAVIMAVVSVKLSPLDQSDAGFIVEAPYLRSSMPSAQTAAAFLTLTNQTGTDDRLIGAASPIASAVALHRHSEDGAGVMRMSQIAGGSTCRTGGATSLPARAII